MKKYINTSNYYLSTTTSKIENETSKNWHFDVADITIDWATLPFNWYYWVDVDFSDADKREIFRIYKREGYRLFYDDRISPNWTSAHIAGASVWLRDFSQLLNSLSTNTDNFWEIEKTWDLSIIIRGWIIYDVNNMNAKNGKITLDDTVFDSSYITTNSELYIVLEYDEVVWWNFVIKTELLLASEWQYPIAKIVVWNNAISEIIDLRWTIINQGNMHKSIYDKHWVNDDAFEMDNMIQSVDWLHMFVTQSQIDLWNSYQNAKQDLLVSWTNIKTINNIPVLWSWDIEISEFTPSNEWTVWQVLKRNSSWWYSWLDENWSWWSTKTFYMPDIDSETTLATAQEAYEWVSAGNAALIYFYSSYQTQTYDLYVYSPSISTANQIKFVMVNLNINKTANTSYDLMLSKTLTLFVYDWVVRYLWESPLIEAWYISTTRNYSTPFTPSLPWSPATKKYIDDKIVSSATMPSNPTVWMLWYDTTNKVLKTYDGNTWDEAWGSGGSTALTTFILNDPDEQKTELYNWCRTFWSGDKVPVIISWDGGACYYWSMGYSDKDVFFNGTNVIEIIYEYEGSEVVWIDEFVWYPIDAKFYVNSDYSNIASVWDDIEYWLNSTKQNPTSTNYKDATVFVWDMPYYRVWNTIADGNNYIIAFYEDSSRMQNGNSSSRTYRNQIRFTFSYTNATWTYVSETHSYIQTLAPYMLRTDYDYATPYTPLYAGSPATKKYVDDNVSWSIKYEDFETSTTVWATLTVSYFTTQITPSANFTIVAGTVKEWMQYIVRVNSWATVYTMSLGTGVTNPFGEDLTLTANKMTTVVLLATSSSTLELFSIRTAE